MSVSIALAFRHLGSRIAALGMKPYVVFVFILRGLEGNLLVLPLLFVAKIISVATLFSLTR